MVTTKKIDTECTQKKWDRRLDTHYKKLAKHEDSNEEDEMQKAVRYIENK